MPRCCSVAGCKSNYKSQHEAVSTFSMPQDVDLREVWVKKIPTDLSKIKKPVICIKHFHERDVIRVDEFVVDGQVNLFPRQYPKLKPGAVPRVFPNLPKYLTTAETSCRRLCDAEQENLDKAIAASLEDHRQYEKQNTLTGLQELSKYFGSIKQQFNCWASIETENNLVLCLVNFTDVPIMVGSVSVASDLSTEIVVNQFQIPKQKVLKTFRIVNTKNQLDALLSFVESLVSDRDTNQKLGVRCIETILQEHFSENDSYQIQFLMEQIKFLCSSPNNRRYSGVSLLLAGTLYAHSPAAYSAVYKSGFIYLPHPSNVRKLIGSFHLNSFSVEGSIEYLEMRKKFLKPHELIVNVLLDEIYIEPHLTFKGGTVYGASKTDSSKLAKTAQVFMVSSVMGKYKDVVSIIPVENLKAEQLKCMMLHVIEQLEKIGFTVISLVSDNNAVNRKAYELLNPNNILQPYINHPMNSNRKLFLLFDTVHILKCIRNNWIAKIDRIIMFPDFYNWSKIIKADFKHLELMYHKEKNLLTKYGHLLSQKVLYPSNIQRQNVKLALRVFDKRNVAALKCIAAKDSDFEGFEQTISFIEIICNWWDIVNVKSAFECQRFNNEYRAPIRKKYIANQFFEKYVFVVKKLEANSFEFQQLKSSDFPCLDKHSRGL